MHTKALINYTYIWYQVMQQLMMWNNLRWIFFFSCLVCNFHVLGGKKNNTVTQAPIAEQNAVTNPLEWLASKARGKGQSSKGGGEWLSFFRAKLIGKERERRRGRGRGRGWCGILCGKKGCHLDKSPSWPSHVFIWCWKINSMAAFWWTHQQAITGIISVPPVERKSNYVAQIDSNRD